MVYPVKITNVEFDDSRHAPIMEKIGSPRQRYKKLMRKNAQELLENPSEWQELQILHRKFEGEKQAAVVKAQKQQVAHRQQTVESRKQWVTSGSEQERFFKFLSELVSKNVLLGGISGVTEENWKTSHYPKIQGLIKEYKLTKFLKNL